MSKKPNIITVTNQKGGVGKTTTAINLATALVAIGQKVTILDLDSQGNASTGFAISNRDKNSYQFFYGKIGFNEAKQETIIPKLSIIPSTLDIAAIDVELAGIEGKEFYLKKAIENSINEIEDDFIIIDNPPSLNLVTVNSLAVADEVLVPMQCEFFAMEGLVQLTNTFNQIKEHLNPKLNLMGVLLTMYDKRNKVTLDVEKEVRNYLGEKVFQTVIPRNVRVSEAPSFGKPVLIYDKDCPGSKAYINLAKEILNKDLINI